jgi:hypothetical protein
MHDLEYLLILDQLRIVIDILQIPELIRLVQLLFIVALRLGCFRLLPIVLIVLVLGRVGVGYFLHNYEVLVHPAIEDFLLGGIVLLSGLLLAQTLFLGGVAAIRLRCFKGLSEHCRTESRHV